MALFPVQRYQNDLDSPEDRSQYLLEKLKRKAEKRKKKLEESAVRNETETNNGEPQEEFRAIVKIQQLLDDTVEEAIPEENTLFLKESSSQSKEFGDVIDNQYIVLGGNEFEKNKNVNMMLSNWLANASIISNDYKENRVSIEDCSFFIPPIKQKLEVMNIKSLFPIQHHIITWLLDVYKKPTPFRPRDLCVSAPTGSGKTLCYVLPIIQLLSQRVERKIRALIVVPTNELAIQVFGYVKTFSGNTNLATMLLTKVVSIESERANLVKIINGKYNSLVDIVITTTGRLEEHLTSTDGFDLSSLQFLVMDEADRIMEQSHSDWMQHLDVHLQCQKFNQGVTTLSYNTLCNRANNMPHKFLFSATLSQDPEKLEKLKLFQPKLISTVVPQTQIINVHNEQQDIETDGKFIGKFTTPAELTEKYILTESHLKPLSLYALIKENNWKCFLCFANSIESVHRLSFVLQHLLGNDLKVEELSSSLSAAMRKSVLLKFANGKINGLICTDALARGIDIPNVEVVISYDNARHIKTYVHRIGRTARAGKQGLAVTILTADELSGYKNLIKSGGKNEVDEMELYSNVEEMKANDYQQILKELQLALQREKQVKNLRMVKEKTKMNEKIEFSEKLQNNLLTDIPHGLIGTNGLPQSWQLTMPGKRSRKELKNPNMGFKKYKLQKKLRKQEKTITTS